MNYLIWALRMVVPLFALAAIISSIRAPGTESLPNGFRKRAIALELPQKPEDIDAIKAVYPEEKIRQEINLDFFLIIPFYTLMFVGMGFWLSKLSIPSANMLGSSLIICAVLAATFDCLENSRMLAL